MAKKKRYRYKVWLEVERVEIDQGGNEIDENERGETFGYEPNKVAELDTKEELDNYLELASSLLPSHLA